MKIPQMLRRLLLLLFIFPSCVFAQDDDDDIIQIRRKPQLPSREVGLISESQNAFNTSMQMSIEARQVIDAALKAMGGIDKISEIKQAKTVATSSISGKMMGQTITNTGELTYVYKSPNEVLTITKSGETIAKTKQVNGASYMLTDGVWQETAAANVSSTKDVSLIQEYNWILKDDKVIYKGVELYRGEQFYVIDVPLKSLSNKALLELKDGTVLIYYNTETFRIRKLVMTGLAKDASLGTMKVNFTVNYSDFRTTNGITTYYLENGNFTANGDQSMNIDVVNTFSLKDYFAKIDVSKFD
jgi:hypothetical protein